MMAKNQTVNRTAAAAEQISTQEILSLSPEDLFQRLGTSTGGLTSAEAQKRLDTYGSNEVARNAKRSALIEFLSHFKSPVTIILIVAAIVSAFLGDEINAGIIIIIVLVSVALDFTQEYRAGKAAEALRKRVANKATVLRDGVKTETDTADLVPGDIVFLSAGDMVPADARVISAKDFYIDQSALTGESFPVEKTVEQVFSTSSLDSNKWTNYLFMGTSVTAGTATATIARTGNATQYGEITRKSAERKPETEFEGGLRRFGYLIMQVTFILIIAVFFINAYFKRSVIDSLLFSVALAVGLTPGLLPVILSINLSRGATAMSKKGVIVKRLAAIQNFGSMDVLCADKTGTLTENKVTVIRHVDMDGKDSEKVFVYSLINSRFQTGLRSPLDEAIMRHEEVNIDQYQRLDEIPYDFIRKRLSVIAKKEQDNFLITKGAPEEVIKVVSSYELDEGIYELTNDARRRIDREYRDLSSQGFRVLSVAYRKVDSKAAYAVADENTLTFIGFIAFTDPIKETAGESIELLRRGGHQAQNSDR